MIDVNKTVSFLAKLSDEQLRNYGQQKIGDPYSIALISTEALRRKEVRAASQGAQGMQEQPKVVDQMVADIAPQQLPEDRGIAQIPAPNMQFAADGGILGYAEGGAVERYQYGGMPPRNSMMGDIPGFVAGPPMFQTQPGVPEEEPILRRLYREMAERSATRRAEEEKRRVAQGYAAPSERMLAETAAAQANPAQDMAQFDAASNLYMTERAAKQAAAAAAAAAPKAVKAAPTVDTTRRATPGAGLGAAAAAAAPKDDPFSMASVRKAQTEALGDSNYKIGELNNQLVDIRNKADTQVQQRLADRRKEIESEGDLYKDRSDRLVARGKELAGQKDQNTGLALLNAGLAIMSTPGGLATALGKGAQVGTAQYAAGVKDLRAAQERLDEANDRISDLRMNRKDLNSREIRALEKDRDNAILDGQKMVFGFAKDIYGMDRKQAENAFTSYMSGQEKKAEITSREGIAGMQERGQSARSAAQIAATLNTPDRLVFNQLLKDSGNDAVKAAETLQKMKTEKFNVYDSYSKYLAGFAGKDPQMVGAPETITKYASRFSALTPPSAVDTGKADRQ